MAKQTGALYFGMGSDATERMEQTSAVDPIEIAERQTVYSGWMKLSVTKFRLSDGRIMAREVLEHGRAACVLPYDAERRRALLVRQFRAPAFLAEGESGLLEAIAGMIDDEDAAATVKREGLEEAGLHLETLEPVCVAWPSPGVMTERVSLYLAPYRARDRISSGGGLAEEHEDIEVIEVPLGDLAAMADDGKLADMKTFALVQTLRLKRPELFGPKP